MVSIEDEKELNALATRLRKRGHVVSWCEIHQGAYELRFKIDYEDFWIRALGGFPDKLKPLIVAKGYPWKTEAEKVDQMLELYEV